jgi:hypothetical protein
MHAGGSLRPENVDIGREMKEFEVNKLEGWSCCKNIFIFNLQNDR